MKKFVAMLIASLFVNALMANDIKELALAMDTKNDFEKLQVFLNENDGEIVKLTLRICGTPQFNGFVDYVEDCPKNHLCLGIKASDEQRGEIYEFDETNIEYYDWRIEPEGLEDKNCKDAMAQTDTQISGYFLFNKLYSDRDTDYMTYDSISKKDIKLSQLNKQNLSRSSTKSENTNTCDIVKALNDFCNSDKTKSLVINKLKSGISNSVSDVSINIISSKASAMLLDMAKDGADERECQKAQSGGVCDVFVAFEGIRDGQKAREEITFEAMVVDDNVDVRKK